MGNGMRQDVVDREIPSATAVLFRDEFDMRPPDATTTWWLYSSRQAPSPTAWIGLAPSAESGIKCGRSGVLCLQRTTRISFVVAHRFRRKRKRGCSPVLKCCPGPIRPTRLELSMTMALKKPSLMFSIAGILCVFKLIKCFYTL